MVGWAWLINLRKEDALALVLYAPDGAVLARNALPPLDRSKATFVAYAGRKRAPAAGDYRIEVIVMRGSTTVLKDEKVVPVR